MNTCRLFTLFIIIAGLSSCGLPFLTDVRDSGETRQFSTSNPAFDSYKAKFEQEGRARLGQPGFVIGDIPINFGDTEGPYNQGLCIKYSDGTREIIIREAWWETQGESYRESLIFHELGHCRLDRDHHNDETNVGNNSVKSSMMNQYIVAPAIYDPHRDAYLQELFTSSTNDLEVSLLRTN